MPQDGRLVLDWYRRYPKMLYYAQSTGKLVGGDGMPWGTGYSGHGNDKNQPGRQALPNQGPIPQGIWGIGEPYDSPHTGPFTLPLEPTLDTNARGRSAFKIHGDSKTDPGSASHGCIILPRPVRERIHSKNPDRLLTVIA